MRFVSLVLGIPSVLLVGVLAPSPASAQSNLLANPDAEAGSIAGWTDPIGHGFGVTSATYVHAGAFSFTAGLFGPSGGWNHELRQDVSVASFATAIDAGQVESVFSGVGRSNEIPGALDAGSVRLEFLDAGALVLASFATGVISPSNTWVPFADTRVVPVGTRTLRVSLLGTRTVGASTDCFFDDLSLSVRSLVTTYCTAKTSSKGCVPALSTSGAPGAAGCASTTFDLTATNLIGAKNGQWFYSGVGPSGAAFLGGHLCVGSKIKRLPIQSTGGAGSLCNGVLTTDFNARICGGTDPQLTAGKQIWAQAQYRDNGFVAPNNVTLTEGLAFVIGP
jgi:hypothetical protein